jgi:hypothetical protein
MKCQNGRKRRKWFLIYKGFFKVQLMGAVPFRGKKHQYLIAADPENGPGYKSGNYTQNDFKHLSTT